MLLAQIWPIYLLLLLSWIHVAVAIKVLIIATTTWYSHFMLNARLADVLVEKGHYVHFLFPESFPRVNSNGTVLAQKVTRYPISKQAYEKQKQTVLSLNYNGDVLFGDAPDIWTRQAWPYQRNLMTVNMLDIIKDKAFLNSLRSEKFDVGLAESFDVCAHAIFYMLGIKTTISTNAISIYPICASYFGFPNSIDFPEMFTASSSPSSEWTLWQRVRNAYELWNSLSVFWRDHASVDGILRELVSPDFPPVAELIRRSSYFFVNTNEMLEISRPLSPKVKYFGGIALERQINGQGKELDERTLSIIEKAKRGVILFTIGSMVDGSKMRAHQRDAFLDAFSLFPDVEFIWRFIMPNDSSIQSVFARHPNVHAFEWLDQHGILAHPKTKALITHCGLNSINEAVDNRIPLLCVPLFGDQFYNAAMINNRKIGIVVEKHNISENSIASSLDAILNQKRYAMNIAKLKRKLDLAPFQPRELFTRLVEFASNFDDNFEELDLAGARMSLIHYFGLDIILLTGIFFVVTTFVIYTLLKYLFRLIFSSKSKID